MLATALLLAHFAIAQTTIVVTDEDKPKTGIDKATVKVWRRGKKLFEETTGTSGAVIVEDTSDYDGSEIIQAIATPRYNSRDFPWPLDTNPIRLTLKQRPCTTTVTVYKPVMEVSGTGTVAIVQEQLTVPCDLRLQLPANPPPPGHIYLLARLDKRFDADRRMYAYRPFYMAVPITQASPIGFSAAPCGCQ